MIKRTVKISRKEYDIFYTADKETVTDMAYDIVNRSAWPSFAYGMYSQGRAFEENGTYYLEWLSQESCD